MAGTRDEQRVEVPGQLDLLDEIPGETRGCANGSEHRREDRDEKSQQA